MIFPKISIVTPNLNQAEFLEYTIRSVLEQGYPNLEYIVIDGGSTDNSKAVIEKYQKQITHYISEPDKGLYDAIQKGFDLASGEIMSWINSDDMYHPRSLFSVATIFNDFPEVNWLTGMNSFYNEHGSTVHVKKPYPHTKYDLMSNPRIFIQQESTFWRRTLWEKAGAYIDRNYKYAGDFELWLRFFRFDPLITVDTLIGGFRIRQDQLSQKHILEYLDESFTAIEKEKPMLSFYDKCQLKDIEAGIDKKYKNRRQITDVTYDFKKGRYVLTDTMSADALKRVMTTRRETMSSFLEYIKNRQKFYPEAVIDVGVGFGTHELYTTFPESEKVLVEPLAQFKNSLDDISSKYDHVSVYMYAAGKSPGSIEFNVHDDLLGSSLYDEVEGKAVDGEKIRVEVKTLDQICSDVIAANKTVLLKIDVQGAELDVLEGAASLLEKTEVIIMEVSLHPFFINGPEFTEVIKYMDERGFVAYDVFNNLYRPIDGALAQLDIVFVKQGGSMRQVSGFATSQQRALLNEMIRSGSSNSKSVVHKSKKTFMESYNRVFEAISKLQATNAQYIIYGYGTMGKTVHAILKEQIVGIVDISSTLLSNKIDKNMIYSPKNLPHMPCDNIIICALGHEQSVQKYLSEELGISGKTYYLLSEQ